MLRKLEFDTIHYAYLNDSPFKYYISILGGGGSEAMLILLIQGGDPESGKIILARSRSTFSGSRNVLISVISNIADREVFLDQEIAKK